jgi:toxin ParE1/3/4
MRYNNPQCKIIKPLCFLQWLRLLIEIAKFPKLGRQRNEILPGIRSLAVDAYLILYISIGQDVEILRVVSGYRDLSNLFADEDD